MGRASATTTAPAADVPDQRPADDVPGEAAPRAVHGAAASRTALRERQPDRLDLVAEHRQHRRQHGRRGDDGHGDDEHGADGERGEHAPCDQHAAHGHDHGDAGDEDGAAGGRSGASDRLASARTCSSLLTGAPQHEQRVVDPDHQADEEHEALRVPVDRRDVPRDECREAERGDHCSDPEQHRDAGGDDRAEGDQQDAERHREADDSARLKSASSWRRTSLSIEPGPTSPTCRPGCADANRFVASSTGPTTSPGCFPATPVARAQLETASRPTASTRVRPSPAGTGRPTVATPLTPA